LPTPTHWQPSALQPAHMSAEWSAVCATAEGVTLDWVAVAKTAQRANDTTAAATTMRLMDVLDLEEGRSVCESDCDDASAGIVL